jgi:hypothetical protein
MLLFIFPCRNNNQPTAIYPLDTVHRGLKKAHVMMREREGEKERERGRKIEREKERKREGERERGGGREGGGGGQAPYGAKSACANRAAYPQPPPPCHALSLSNLSPSYVEVRKSSPLQRAKSKESFWYRSPGRPRDSRFEDYDSGLRISGLRISVKFCTSKAISMEMWHFPSVLEDWLTEFEIRKSGIVIRSLIIRIMFRLNIAMGDTPAGTLAGCGGLAVSHSVPAWVSVEVRR